MQEFNLEEEIIDNYKVTKEMKKVWKTEIELLTKLEQVCNKYGLKYFADSGTLLGTIRHKGFIPWDDDIDVVMLREDYDKLISLAETEFDEEIFLQTAYSDKGYYRGHAQLRKNNTAEILPHEGRRVQFNQGIFLDIFPLDELSKYNIINKIKFYVLRIYKKIFVTMYYKFDVTNSVKSKIKLLIKKAFLKKDYKKMYKRFENISKKVIFGSGKLDKISYYDKYKKYKRLDREYFKENIEVPFENVKISIPKEYDKILKRYYGENYMKPANIPSTHGTVIVDADKSYKEII